MCHTAAVHLNYQTLILEVSADSSDPVPGAGRTFCLHKGIMLFTLQRESS